MTKQTLKNINNNKNNKNNNLEEKKMTKQTLRAMYAQYGEKLFRDKVKLKGVVKKLIGKEDKNMILLAIEQGIVTTIMDKVHTLDNEKIERIKNRLITQFMWREDMANKVVEYFVYVKFGNNIISNNTDIFKAEGEQEKEIANQKNQVIESEKNRPVLVYVKNKSLLDGDGQNKPVLVDGKDKSLLDGDGQNKLVLVDGKNKSLLDGDGQNKPILLGKQKELLLGEQNKTLLIGQNKILFIGQNKPLLIAQSQMLLIEHKPFKECRNLIDLKTVKEDKLDNRSIKKERKIILSKKLKIHLRDMKKNNVFKSSPKYRNLISIIASSRLKKIYILNNSKALKMMPYESSSNKLENLLTG
ncbi:hypothetical protein AN641_09040 [Candidatus Epulonipiscioides gigas]|nr:hypothetical protein AN641_09040 [Epulopiscium sp. SCG-C07WGA-EpuloA2]